MGISASTTRYLTRNYWPDNNETTLYIPENELTLEELCEYAKDYFGDRYDLKKINISFEKIHTSCIDYDLYDPDDWTDFTVINLT